MTQEKVNVTRYDTDLSGLKEEQVKSRIHLGLINKTNKVIGKSTWDIVKTNVLSFFNILLFIIAGLLIFSGHFGDLFFLCVIIPNIGIGLYEDFKAKYLLSKLKLITDPRCVVIRDSKEISVSSDKVVLDDMMVLTSGMQICTDGIIKEGHLLVNESMLTGESDDVSKEVGDVIYSGSYVISGKAYARADKIGKDSYIETLQAKASHFKRSNSEILRSIKRLFLILGIIVITLFTAMIVTYATQRRFTDFESFKTQIEYIAGSMIAMIPSGLYLLTSVTLATSVINLAKKQAQVQDFYSIEMLARSNVLCVDKTGTITDGTLTLKKLIQIDKQYETYQLGQMISNLLTATGDDNQTAKALKKEFNYSSTSKCITSLPFSSKNKYSAATFQGGNTIVLGAIETLNIAGKVGLIKRSDEFTYQGYRVLVLGVSKEAISGDCLKEEVQPVALIVLKDNIKPNALKTFTWFKENGVEVKVISGDNVSTVSEIARQVGIENSDRAISLENKSLEEVELIASEYTVFGRVSPEQKEIIIHTLKKEKKTVAMTGDGVNDILALKRADCSIAMANGSDAAKNISHIVLLDNDFDHLPDVVAEGRRVVNNIQRTSSLFLTKTFFAIFLTITFLIATIVTSNPSVVYPFVPKNLYLWEIVSIGLASFFVALEPNKEPIQGSFKKNIAKKVIPASIAIISPVIIVYILFILQYFNVAMTQVYPDYINEQATVTSQIASSMCTILISIISIAILIKVCKKLTKYRLIVCLVTLITIISALGGCWLYTFLTNKPNFLGIDFNLLRGVNYFQITVISIVIIGLFFNLTTFFGILFGGSNEDDKD